MLITAVSSLRFHFGLFVDRESRHAAAIPLGFLNCIQLDGLVEAAIPAWDGHNRLSRLGMFVFPRLLLYRSWWRSRQFYLRSKRGGTHFTLRCSEYHVTEEYKFFVSHKYENLALLYGVVPNPHLNQYTFSSLPWEKVECTDDCCS